MPHTKFLDQVLDKDSTMLPEDIRLVLIAMRAESNEHAERRLGIMETLLAEHIKACDESKNDMKTLLEIVQAMEGSIKVANWMKKFVMWSAGLIGSIYAMYSMWKGQ